MSRTPDRRLQALRLAVDLYAGREHDELHAVLHAADEFLRYLTARAAVLTVADPVIAEQATPSQHIPFTRGADMAITITDTQQATYPAPSEADSRGFPVTGDVITIAESSGGTVVALTKNPDGSATFAAVAPGSAQVSWTDNTLSFADTINVTAGAAATLVVGAPVIAEQPPAAPPSA
jgi:hypothetical protein